MGVVGVVGVAEGLAQAWSSAVLAQVGTADVKVLRMDALPLAEEVHEADEVLLVLDGCLELDVDGVVVPVRTGELVVVPAGTVHAVRPGSHGTLLIVERTEG